MASASIDADCVSAHAPNLVTAMPVLARSAATTALVPPLVDIASALRGQVARLVDEHHRDVTPHGVGELTGVADQLLGVVVDEQRGPALRAHQDVEQGGVEVHADTVSTRQERMTESTSSRTRAIVASSAPSTLSRS